MKNAALSFLVLVGTLGICQASLAEPTSKTVEIRVSDVIVPGGFDSNSDAYVIETGLFPNGCYRWESAETKAVQQNVIEVRSYATVQSGMCPMVMVPFHKEVRLGKLARGTYTLRFLNSDDTYLEEKLVIE